MKNNFDWHSVLAGSLGNIIEWYDFILFSYLSSILVTNFFPHENKIAGLTSVFGAFALGYIVRPIGAIFFGKIADKYGRVIALKSSLFCITITMFLTALLPTFEEIGVWAPFLMILLRLIQGINIGGEHAGGIIYLGEIAKPKYRALIVSMKNSAANIGILAALCVSSLFFSLFTVTQMQHWGWRVAYLLGGLAGLLFFLLRKNIQETELFLQKESIQSLLNKPSLSTVLRSILKVILTISMGASLFYITFVYLPTYLHFIHALDLSEALRLITFCSILSLFLVPLAAYLSDKVGRKILIIFVSFSLMITAFFIFYLFHSHINFYIYLAALWLVVLSSIEQGVIDSMVIENYPLSRRHYTEIALAYNIGYALFGGATPFICTWLWWKTGDSFVPAYYLLFTAIITIGAVLTLKETKGITLKKFK